MKMPQTPPDWSLLWEGARQRRNAAMIDAESFVASQRYLHWDEMRHRPKEHGLSYEDAWAVVKVARVLRYQKIPLKDKTGRPCVFFVSAPMFEKLHRVDQRAGGTLATQETPEAVTNPETRDQYYVSSLIEESITSSQLEGAVTTRVVATEMLRTGRAPRDRSERMILNNYRTMRQLREWKEQDLTPELILEIHRMISEEALDVADGAGRWRRAEEDVRVENVEGDIVHNPPLARELPERIADFCTFANERAIKGYLHPVLRSIMLHYWLAYDHPFVDGNGRTARALFYWSMLRHGYWLMEFISLSSILLKAPAKYYRAFLFTETDGNDLNYFLLHQLETLEQAINSLHAWIGKKAGEQARIRQEIRSLGLFNHRQATLLQHARRCPAADYTVTGHMTSHSISNETARNDLIHLAKIGLLRQVRRGRVWHFFPAGDLEARIHGLSSTE